jgi:hypothetical protein
MKVFKRRLNSRGFGHVEMFVAIVVVAIVLISGFYVVHKNTSHAGSAGCINKTYSYGSSGPCVVYLQQFINVVGAQYHFSWYTHLNVNGVYGINTKDEVLKFEKRVNIAQDGIVTPKLWNVICDGGLYMKGVFGSNNSAYVLSRDVGCTNSMIYW